MPAAIALIAIPAVMLVTGAASAGLKDRIDGAQEEAEALTAKIEDRNARLAGLEERAASAQSRIDELSSLLAIGEERSSQLSIELGQAEEQLRESQARLGRARGILATRLVAIYKGEDPDYLDLVLESSDFEDLTSRAEYLNELRDADATVVDRVEALHDEVNEGFKQVTDAKAAVDDHNRELVAARGEVAKLHASIRNEAGELAAARRAEESTLAELRSQIDEWKAELGTEQTAALFGDGGWAIPVIHRHVRVRRQLPRPQPLERSGWRVPDHPLDLEGLRRQGAAAPGSSGRAAPDRRKDLGRRRPRRLVLRLACDLLQVSGPVERVQGGGVAGGEAALLQLDPGVGEVVDGAGEVGLVADEQHLAAPGGQLERIEAAAAESLVDLGLQGSISTSAECLAGDPRRLQGPHLRAGQAGVELDPERGQRLARPLATASRPWRSACAPRRRRLRALGVSVAQ